MFAPLNSVLNCPIKWWIEIINLMIIIINFIANQLAVKGIYYYSMLASGANDLYTSLNTIISLYDNYATTYKGGDNCALAQQWKEKGTLLVTPPLHNYTRDYNILDTAPYTEHAFTYIQQSYLVCIMCSEIETIMCVYTITLLLIFIFQRKN